MILQESGFGIRAIIATGKLPSTICEPAGQVKFLVCYRQLGSLLQIQVSLRSDKQMDIILFTEFLKKKKKWSIKKHGFYGMK